MNTITRGIIVPFAVSVIVIIGVVAFVTRSPDHAPMFDPSAFEIVDLTHPFAPGIPVYPGGVPFTIESVAQVGSHGFYANKFSMGEHTGTHVDAPCHFVAGKCVDQIEPHTLTGPAVVINTNESIGSLTVALVRMWERLHQPIPFGAIVFLTTGAGQRWPTAHYIGRDGVHPEFPAYTVEAARFLIEERHAAALGIDTLSTDPGNSTTFDEHKVALGLGAYHIENVANLDQLPATGAWVIVAPLPIKGGSGAPARVFAFVPPTTQK